MLINFLNHFIRNHIAKSILGLTVFGTFSCGCLADSLTLSPIGFTYHLYPTEYGIFMPNRINGNGKHPITIHPEFALSYKSKYMQYNAFWMKDSMANDSFGFLVGPKYDLIDDIWSVGFVVGPYIRDKESYHNPFIITDIGNFNVIPFYGITTTFSLPQKISPELSFVINHVVIHSTLGVKFAF